MKRIVTVIAQVTNILFVNCGVYLTVNDPMKGPEEAPPRDPLLSAFSDSIPDDEIERTADELVDEAQHWMAVAEGRA